MEYNMFKKILIQVIVIISASLVLGFTVNVIHPNKVRISNERPIDTAAEDTVFQQESVHETKAVVINKDQLKNLMATQKIVIIDARTPDEFDAGYIPGAINIPYELLGEYIETVDDLDKVTWTITYCEGPPCEKSQAFAFELVDMGFKRVAYYDAGLNDWQTTENVEK